MKMKKKWILLKTSGEQMSKQDGHNKMFERKKYCFKFLAASTIVMQKDLKHPINIIWASITIIYFVTLEAYYG